MRLKLVLFLVLPLCACASFVTKTEETLLKEKEKNVYILKKDIDLETRKLKKGDAVRILIAAGRDWLKVYAYPIGKEKLKAERYLLIYLFEEEFENKKFNLDLFNEKLSAMVESKDESLLLDKRALKVKKK